MNESEAAAGCVCAVTPVYLSTQNPPGVSWVARHVEGGLNRRTGSADVFNMFRRVVDGSHSCSGFEKGDFWVLRLFFTFTLFAITFILIIICVLSFDLCSSEMLVIVAWEKKCIHKKIIWLIKDMNKRSHMAPLLFSSLFSISLKFWNQRRICPTVCVQSAS